MNWDIEKFSAVYAAENKTMFRIWRDVYGDDYPEEVEPTSFVTKTDLIRIAHFLSISSGKTFLDLGCGRGGPGLWVARETGADLIGIDLSPIAVEQAKQRVSDFDLEGHARFVEADINATGLEDKSCDGSISIDVLLFVPNKIAAMTEVARVLRSGARFVFTTWEKPSETDHHLLLQDSGFEVEEYYEKPDRKRRQHAVYERILAEQATLIKEMGETAARPIINEATRSRTKRRTREAADSRHVLIVCRKI